MTVVPKESVVDLLPLTPCVQRANWGVPARRSLAARFYAHNTDAGISHTDVCSAIAIGTHSSAETVLADDSRTLLDYIRNEVIEVDSNKVEHYTRLHRHGLPFVLRLISVESPQPIHVHPDGVEAARLHESDSVRWPDSLGRAEMVVALTDVHALFGFRGADAIVAELARVPEFADAAGRAATDAFVRVVKSGRGAGPDALRELFLSFMNARPEHVRKCLENVIDRFGRMPKAALSDDDDLLLRLHERFAGDLMCFCVYFFNHVTLQPGEAVFIHPKEPHCYLKGDLIEVSSSSANIARAGLCAEDEVDREQFLNLLNFDDSPVEVSWTLETPDDGTDFLIMCADIEGREERRLYDGVCSASRRVHAGDASFAGGKATQTECVYVRATLQCVASYVLTFFEQGTISHRGTEWRGIHSCAERRRDNDDSDTKWECLLFAGRVEVCVIFNHADVVGCGDATASGARGNQRDIYAGWVVCDIIKPVSTTSGKTTFVSVRCRSDARPS